MGVLGSLGQPPYTDKVVVRPAALVHAVPGRKTLSLTYLPSSATRLPPPAGDLFVPQTLSRYKDDDAIFIGPGGLCRRVERAGRCGRLAPVARPRSERDLQRKGASEDV